MNRVDKVFAFIVSYKEENDGIAPSYEEIMEGCAITTKSIVYYYLNILEGDGRIRRVGKKKSSRNIQVVGGNWHFAIASK